jgi:hypothetical protein
VKLDANTINELMEVFRPFLEDERSRHPFLVLALGNDAPVLQHITWSGSVAKFIPQMLCRLAEYGEIEPGRQALRTLLQYVRSQVGVDVQQRIDKLRPLIDLRSSTSTPNACLFILGLSPFVSPEDFFREWLNSDKPFNHAWSLVGRTDYLQSLNEFVESTQQRIAILPGRGGIGKTKLLHAFAEQFNHSEFILRFAEQGVTITTENVGNLPANPCVIVVDDAHQRERDLSVLLALVRQHPTIKLILSSRPYAADYLQVLIRQAGIDSGQLKRLDELRELSREDIKALARQALGSEYVRFADRLASVTKDCPLVTVVGGRLLAEKAIPPDLLERDAAFQHDVLSRFQDALIGKVSQCIEPEFCRELLNLIAAVTPIRLTSEHFQQVAAEALKVERSKLVRSIGILEQSGILLRRGDTLRITPDVLADHILNEACLTPQGESTGYTQQVFKRFQDICPTAVLRNLAELDWRIRHTRDRETDLLANIWQEIREEFRKVSNSRRYHLLDLLKEVAHYQPSQTLKLVELAMREPATTSENERSSDFYTHSRVLYQLPELLKRISHNLKYLPRCCELLWKLGRDDSQELDSYPKHARRILIDLARYEIDKSPIFNQNVLEAVARWLKKPDASTHIDVLLDILDPLLAKSFPWTRTEGLTVNFYSSYVSREKTQSIRNQALDIITQRFNSEQPKVILRVLKSLKEALQEPSDFLGQKHIEQIEEWIPEQLKILQLISELNERESNPLVHLEIVKTLDWHAQHSSSPIVKEGSQSILTSILDSYELRLTGVLSHSYDLDWLLSDEEKSETNYDRYEQHINELCLTVAREFLKRHPEAYQGVKILNQWLQNIIDVGVQPEASVFFSNLCEVIAPSYATKMCEAIIEIGDCPLTLHFTSLLHKVRIADVYCAITISQRALNTQIPALCISIAQVYLSCRENLQLADFELIQNLLIHAHLGVREFAISSLRKLGIVQPKLTINMVLNVDINESTKLASRLCQLFHRNTGISPEALTNEDLERLLVKLEPTATIDEYHISQFIAYTSKRLPHSLVQFLMKRIEHDEKDDKGEYQPLPFQGFNNRLESIAKSKEYRNILIDIRNQALKRTHTKKKWLPVLFKEISLVPNNTDSDIQDMFPHKTSPICSSYKDEALVFSPTSLDVLSEWIDSGDRNKIEAVSCLLSDAPKAFIFQNVEFLSNLLEQAYDIGDDCYNTVSSDLFQSVTSGIRSGIPGQPFPEDIAIKEQSAAVARQLVAESPSQRFYESLAKDAQDSIKFWEKRWEEQFDGF